MSKMIAIGAAAAVVGVLGATFLVPYLRNSDGDPFAACRASVIAGGPGNIGGPFELVNSKGETVTDKDVLTKPSLIYFGYTSCPDVCPLDAARNAEALDLLTEAGTEAQTVFISIDPARDTPDVVGEYVSYIHEEMIGLTGSLEQVTAASKSYKTYFRLHEPEEGEEFYLVDHSTQTYLVLPEHGFVEFFKRADTAEEMAKRSTCFIDNA